MQKTGWGPGLLQDDSRELSRWLASRPDARRQAREVAHQIKERNMNDKNLPQVPESQANGDNTTDHLGRPFEYTSDDMRDYARAALASPAAQAQPLARLNAWPEAYPDGMTEQDVKNELHDYRHMLEEVPKVYDHVTGGLLTKTNYYASVVIGEADNHLNKLVAEALEEAAPKALAPDAAGWREHVEERLRAWRQRHMNRSGDRLALDDFMDQQSLGDLIDFVCDEWEAPTLATSAHPVAPAAESADPMALMHSRELIRLADILRDCKRLVSTEGNAERILRDAASALAAHPVAPAAVKYVPVDSKLRDANWNHPNDDEKRTPECNAALDARGDDEGQGLDGYWKWGFRAGWNAALAAAPSAQPVEAMAAKCRALEKENIRLIQALEQARDHIDMGALEVSHCKDAALIREALGDAARKGQEGGA